MTFRLTWCIVAVGVSPNPLIPSEVKALKVSKWGTIEVNEETMQSSIPELFAGGDIVRGGATVILAMGDGRKAAASMDQYLQEKLSSQLTICLLTILLFLLIGLNRHL